MRIYDQIEVDRLKADFAKQMEALKKEYEQINQKAAETVLN